jgi:hypothetical protein
VVEAPQDVAQRWTIDVCATCGRLASWPFCEHGQAAHARVGRAERWTITVHVKPAQPGNYLRRVGRPAA